MTDDITIAGTKNGKPIYRLPRTEEPLSFMQKYLGEATFTALSLTAIVKVASVLALGLAAKEAGDDSILEKMVDGVEKTVDGEEVLAHPPSYEAASKAGANSFASLGAGVKGLSFTQSMGVVAAGGVAGALVNKHQVQKKATEGVEIAPPSRINSGLFRGALSGFVMGAGIPMALLSIVGVSLAGIAGPILLGLGAVSAAYGAYSQSKKFFDKADGDYKSIANAYNKQEGARGLTPQGAVETTKEIAKATTIGAVGASAGVDGNEIGSAITGAVTGMDEAPQKAWHPSQDRAEGFSFAKKVMEEREGKMIGDGVKEVVGTFMGTR